MRRPPWALVVLLLIGVGLAAGAVSVYGDQHSGTAGTAKVGDCTGGRKYEPGIRCTGTWLVGGESVFTGGRVVVGRIEGAGFGDVGKTIDVRIHGSDHATKPSLGTVLVLLGLSLPILALAIYGLIGWWRGPG